MSRARRWLVVIPPHRSKDGRLRGEQGISVKDGLICREYLGKEHGRWVRVLPTLSAPLLC